MKHITGYNINLFLLFLILSACNSNTNEEDLFQYKGSTIGDNSAVVNIIQQLKHQEDFKDVALATNTEPYGMTIHYDSLKESATIKEMQDTAIFNATFLFILIHNADWVTFDFGEQEYTINKNELQDWYQDDLTEFEDEETVIKHMEAQIKEKSNVDKLLNDQ
ncbi:protein of unknown function [Oceanobacillus limi]|uniref:DUF4825 domain-containing protein n=1 Tax=Oceanobacillus limi TaxID=930131 RepID=A0A1I0GLT9_9BACI|nr:DUF4825 domain-containing protein [Oceanobacillus limi]SET71910.1 protein of unknown function [Oceanobacillus limi]